MSEAHHRIPVVGIPRALYFFYYGKAWEKFFQKVGFCTLISPPTNKKILEKSINLSVEELCIPLKVFYGHCEFLKTRCDFVFVPRYISVTKNTFTCPKLLVLPDTVKFVVPDLHVLSLSFKKSEVPGMGQFFLMGCRIMRKIYFSNPGIKFLNLTKMRQLFKKTLWEEREKSEIKPLSFFTNSHSTSSIPIMVIGHPYNLEDSFINHNLFNTLEELGLKVITPKQISAKIIREELKNLPFIYWSQEREIAASAYFALKQSFIKGIILVSSFGCGPDSLIAEQIVQDAKQYKKPVMQLFLDENTSQVNIQTRIEAFADMIRARK